MGKIKTSKTTAKRVIVTNSGRLKTGRVGMRHNAMAAPRRRAKQGTTVSMCTTRTRAIRKLLPNHGL